jgi:hypothetical protein
MLLKEVILFNQAEKNPKTLRKYPRGVKMRSNAKDVGTYLQEVEVDRRESLTKLRLLCLEILDGYEESMEYGMPSYKKDSEVEIEVAFASQKQYISLYILKEEVLNKHRHLLKGLNLGKGCIRYSKPEKIDFNVVEKLLRDSYLSESEIC